jgi:chromosome segregation protein
MQQDNTTAQVTTLAELGILGRPMRVRVRAMILDNFKSFPKKTRIPLPDGFTTISGPNGSGKSNLIDALQFVLSTSTSKGMRAERVSDLISTMGNKPSCRVCLEFEVVWGSKDGRPPEKKIFELGRSVRRRKSGAESRYLLDGQQIRLSDLQDVMRLLGLPTSGQNFVLQNDVIRLTSMGPVARRQVLDELAGTKEFDKRIGLAEVELKGSDDLTHDTRLILEELGQRLEQLKKERDQALSFRTLTESQEGLEGDLVVLDVTEADVAVVKKQEEHAGTTKRRRSCEIKLEKLEREERKAKKELEAIETELASKGEGERMDAFRAVEELRVRIEGANTKAAELTAELEASAKQRPELVSAVENSQKATTGATGLIEDIEAALLEKQARLDALGQRFEAASAGLQQHNRDSVGKADRMRELRQECERLRAEEAALSAKDRVLGDSLGRKETEQKLLAETVNAGKARRDALHSSNVEASTAHRENREAFAEIDARRTRLVQHIHDLRHGLESIGGRLHKARTDVATAKAVREQAHMHGGGRALEAIRRAKVKGVHGQVANLVDFETQYATALETAAGGRLNYVVVDDEHVASRCIALIKRERAGRLSFAPLSKIRSPRAPGATPRGKGIVGYAVNLVSSKKKYGTIMQVTFGDTLVVETLEDAKALIGRYRMVTLEGDLVERNAIMSGGSRRQGGGLLAAASRAAQLIKERERVVVDLEKHREAARGGVTKAEAELATIAAEVETKRNAFAEGQSNAASLARELSELEASLAPQATRLEVLDAELTTLRADQEKIAGLGELRAKLAVADKEMEAIDDPDALKAFEELAAETAKIEAEQRPLEGQVNALRLELATAMSQQSAAAARVEAATAIVTKADAAYAATKAKCIEIAGSVTGLIAERATKQKELESLSSELTELARRRDTAREVAQQAHDRSREVAGTVTALGERLTEIGAELEELCVKAGELRAAAEAREIEVPGPEEAPPDLAKERKRIASRLAEVQSKLRKLGAVNHLAIEQYESSVERHEELGKKIEVLEEEKLQIRERIAALQGKKRSAFLEAFAEVEVAFADTFKELARGQGRLILENPKDPFAGGLIIKCSPRGKKFSRMESMSGGEKALTALALIFALQEVNPAPLFIFDEVDKDLDGVNTMILADAIRRRSEDRQYLTISHHRVLLERSNQTLGVTMRKGHGTQVTGVTMSTLTEMSAADKASDNASAEAVGAAS